MVIDIENNANDKKLNIEAVKDAIIFSSSYLKDALGLEFAHFIIANELWSFLSKRTGTFETTLKASQIDVLSNHGT